MKRKRRDGYDPDDRVHKQISPEAYAICARNGAVITPGMREDNSPNFRGLTDEWWATLLAKKPEDFIALVNVARADFPTYCALLLRVVSRITLDKIPFIWNEGQQIVWNRMVARQLRGQPMFFVILKARQMGITTFVAAWHHFNAWKGEDVHALNVVHNDKLAERVIGFFRLFHDNLPPVGGMRPDLRAKSATARIPKSEVYYAERRCHIETHIAKNLDPRGNFSRFVGLSEAAFYPALDEFCDALFPSLPSIGSPSRASCSIIIESTPNGQNDFYDYWDDAKDPDSEFWGIFLPWYVMPSEYSCPIPEDECLTTEEIAIKRRLSLIRRNIDGQDVTAEQMYWRRITLANKPFAGNVEAFDAAYPSDDETCFLLQSKSVFTDDLRYLHACVQDAAVRAKDHWEDHGLKTNGPAFGELEFPKLRSPFGPENAVSWQVFSRPRFVPKPSGSLRIWEQPQPNHVYVAGLDTAGGEGGGEKRDYSAVVMFDVYTGYQVVEFRSRDIRPEYFADMAVHLFAWYNKATVLPEVNHLGSVVMKRMMNDWGYQNVAHEEKWDEVGVKKDKPGFYTKPMNRPLIFTGMIWLIQERLLQVSSPDLVREMSNFKQEGMQFTTAKKGQHDDLVIACGLACMAIRQSPKFLMLAENARRKRPQVPSAVDLGLNRSPHNARREIIRGADNDDELKAKIFKHLHDMPAPGHQNRWWGF